MTATGEDGEPTEAGFRQLLREAARQCNMVLQHEHGNRLHHCAEGLTHAEDRLGRGQRFPWLRSEGPQNGS